MSSERQRDVRLGYVRRAREQGHRSRLFGRAIANCTTALRLRAICSCAEYSVLLAVPRCRRYHHIVIWGLLAAWVHAVARRSSCTLGQGSGARFLNGAQSLSVMRSKIAALTEGRARMRAHQSAMAGYCAQRASSL